MRGTSPPATLTETALSPAPVPTRCSSCSWGWCWSSPARCWCTHLVGAPSEALRTALPDAWRPREIRDLLSTAQERFERTPIGEIPISVLIAMILIIAIAWSMPESAIRRAALPLVEPVAVTSGLDQSWFMFAPDPLRRLETVEVRVETARGDQRVWRFPLGNAVTQFTWYRWHKVKE